MKITCAFVIWKLKNIVGWDTHTIHTPKKKKKKSAAIGVIV